MSTIEIPLTQGQFALVDDEDAAAVLAHKWYAVRSVPGYTFYADRKIRRPDGSRAHMKLHTFLTGWPLVDHINLDGLDNRRSNLRPATTAQNARNQRRYRNNTSGYKGVTWHRRDQNWQAYIRVDGCRHHLGAHVTPEEAARAYDAAAREYFGEFAYLNFPTEEPK